MGYAVLINLIKAPGGYSSGRFSLLAYSEIGLSIVITVKGSLEGIPVLITCQKGKAVERLPIGLSEQFVLHCFQQFA